MQLFGPDLAKSPDIESLIAALDEAGVATAILTAGLSDPAHTKRRGAPFVPRRPCFGTVVGKAIAHVVQQQVGVGPDQLGAVLGPVGQAMRDKGGPVADRTAGGNKRVLAAQHLRVEVGGGGGDGGEAGEGRGELGGRGKGMGAELYI